jgi:hypothetical protein
MADTISDDFSPKKDSTKKVIYCPNIKFNKKISLLRQKESPYFRKKLQI